MNEKISLITYYLHTVHIALFLFTQYCSSIAGSLPLAVTMPNDTEAAALRARLLDKKSTDAAAALEQMATAAR
jgi:hypothetical protein